MAAKCKYCGDVYGKDEVFFMKLFWMIFFGRGAWSRGNYCCEGHYERHTDKNWPEVRMAGLKRMPIRLLKIFGIFIIIGIYGKIQSCMNPKVNEAPQSTIQSTIDSAKIDTLNKNDGKVKKKKNAAKSSKMEESKKTESVNETQDGSSESLPKE